MSVRVEVRDLGLAVGDRVILKGVELVVQPGEIVAVLGLSGSGKTSLLRCLAGLLRPTSGQIRIGEVDLAALSEAALNDQRRRMGMVFQYAALFDSLSVYENVIFGLRYHQRLPEAELRATAAARLAAVGLAGTEALLPAQLSGGMRKRVGLARALATQPQIVFYDEPTSGLDPVGAGLIDELIVRVRDETGVTSVIVSHDVASVLRHADRVAFLYDGYIRLCDTPARVRGSSDPVVQQFLEGRPDGPITSLSTIS